MKQFTTSLHGLEIGLRPGYSLPPLESTNLYINKPLPPLPLQASPKMRIPRKPVASGDSRRKTTKTLAYENRPLPLCPVLQLPQIKERSSSPSLWRPSSTRLRTDHKAPRRDNVSDRNTCALGLTTCSPSPAKNTSQACSVSNPRRSAGSTVPSFGPEIDGLSSKNSSWGPSTPQTNTSAFVYTNKSVLRRSNDSKSSRGIPHIVFEDTLPSRWEFGEEFLADGRRPSHVSPYRAISPQQPRAEYSTSLQVPDTLSPALSCPSLFVAAQNSRRREPTQSMISSRSSSSRPQKTPYPEQGSFAPQLVLPSGYDHMPSPRSAFDSDSEDDEENNSSTRKGLLRLKSTKGRSSVDVSKPAGRKGRQLSGIFAGVRNLWQSSRADKRRQGLIGHAKVASEGAGV